MQVTDIKTYLVYPQSHHAGMIGGKNWLFVKVETDEGIVGWGECYTQLDRDKAIEQHVHEIKRYVVGGDPFNIKHVTRSVYDDFAGRRGSMDLFSALSGIEQALWDVVGKALGAARVPPAGRRLSGQDSRLCQRLVRRGQDARAVRRVGRRRPCSAALRRSSSIPSPGRGACTWTKR